MVKLEMPDLRYHRAQLLTAAVMREIAEHLDALQDLGRWAQDQGVEAPAALKPHAEVHDKIMKLFMQEGVEVLSDNDRRKAGLSPRNDKGWTPEELMAYEKVRLALITAPPAPVIVKATD